jgi:hypothetical protein
MDSQATPTTANAVEQKTTEPLHFVALKCFSSFQDLVISNISSSSVSLCIYNRSTVI